MVRERADQLPIQVFRPSIIAGDSDTGWTASFNVMYAPLKAFQRYRVYAIPARRRAPVDRPPPLRATEPALLAGPDELPGTA